MWLILLRKYWVIAALALMLFVGVPYLHHRWYTDGSLANQAKQDRQHVLDLAKLEQERDEAFRLLRKAEQAVASEKAAKDSALKEASKAPKVLVKVVHDEKDCPVASVGDDFERVWNSQSKAAAPSH